MPRCVAEERGRGAYRALWEYVKSEAREAPDVCSIRLCVELENERAQGVYEHLGMQVLPYRVYTYDTSSAPTPAQLSELLHEHTEFDDAPESNLDTATLTVPTDTLTSQTLEGVTVCLPSL